MKKITVTDKAKSKTITLFVANDALQPAPDQNTLKRILGGLSAQLYQSHADNDRIYIKAIARSLPEVTIYYSVNNGAPQQQTLNLGKMEIGELSITLSEEKAEAVSEFANIEKDLQKKRNHSWLGEVPIDSARPEVVIPPSDIKIIAGRLWSRKQKTSTETLHDIGYLTLTNAESHLGNAKREYSASITQKIEAECTSVIDASALTSSYTNGRWEKYCSQVTAALRRQEKEVQAELDKTIKTQSAAIGGKREAFEASVIQFASSQHEYKYVTNKLAEAIYHAAKEYYIARWNECNSAPDLEAAFTQARKEFNDIFGEIVGINPDFSLTSLHDAVHAIHAKCEASKQNPEQTAKVLEALVTGMLDRMPAKYKPLLQKRLAAYSDEVERIPAANAPLKKFVFQEKSKAAISNYQRASISIQQTASADIEALTQDLINAQQILQKTVTILEANDVQTTLDTARNNKAAYLEYLKEYDKQFADFTSRSSELGSIRKQLDDLRAHINKIDNLHLSNEAKIALKGIFGDKLHAIRQAEQRLERLSTVLNDEILEDLAYQLDTAEKTGSSLSKLEFKPFSDVTKKLGEVKSQAVQLAADIEAISFPTEDALLAYLEKISLKQSKKISPNNPDLIGSSLNNVITAVKSSATAIRDAISENKPALMNDNAALNNELGIIEGNIATYERDSADLLRCHLLMNILGNTAYWGRLAQRTREESITAIINADDNNYVTLPKPVFDLLRIAKANPNWHQNPEQARALLAAFRAYTQANPKDNRNARVHALFAIIDTPNMDTPQDIETSMQNNAKMLPPNPVIMTPDNIPTVSRRPSFRERHPVLTDALIYGAIGLIAGPVVIAALALTAKVWLPVLIIGAAVAGGGALIGFIAGAIKGKIQERRQRKAAEAALAPEEQPAPALSPVPQRRNQSQTDILAPGEHVPTQEELDQQLADLGNMVEAMQKPAAPAATSASVVPHSVFRAGQQFETVPQEELTFTPAAIMDAGALSANFVDALAAEFTKSGFLGLGRDSTSAAAAQEAVRKWKYKRNHPEVSADANMEQFLNEMSEIKGCTKQKITEVLNRVVDAEPRNIDDRIFTRSPLNNYGLEEMFAKKRSSNDLE